MACRVYLEPPAPQDRPERTARQVLKAARALKERAARQAPPASKVRVARKVTRGSKVRQAPKALKGSPG
jgi:hypothetical protein